MINPGCELAENLSFMHTVTLDTITVLTGNTAEIQSAEQRLGNSNEYHSQENGCCAIYRHSHYRKLGSTIHCQIFTLW